MKYLIVALAAGWMAVAAPGLNADENYTEATPEEALRVVDAVRTLRGLLDHIQGPALDAANGWQVEYRSPGGASVLAPMPEDQKAARKAEFRQAMIDALVFTESPRKEL